MEKEQRKKEFLRKLIDLPRPIVTDLKAIAKESNQSLKSFIEELVVKEVQNRFQRPPKNGVNTGNA